MEISIGLLGGSGRMGQAVQQVIAESRDLTLGGIITRADLYKKKEKKLQFDVVIDFSRPEALLKMARICAEMGVPLVSGTTGLTPGHMAKIKQASKKCPIMWAPNMSIGIAVLRRSLKALSAVKNWDFQIEEVHHRKKVDSPSGTARLLQSDLSRLVSRKLPPVLSVRGGGVPGTHTVLAMGGEEVLTFSHQALSRRIFAEGACHVSRWLVGRKPGLYTFDEVIGLT